MSALKCKLAMSMVLILWASAISFAKAKRVGYDPRIQMHDAPVPSEVLSAKTLALIVKVMDKPGSDVAEEYRKRIEASAVAEIQKRNRFQLVSDPAKADLVCLLIEFSFDYWHEAHNGNKGIRARWNGFKWNLLPPEAIIILKGGNDAHRTARPVWMKTRIMPVGPVWVHERGNKLPTRMISDFHHAFAKAEKKEKGKTELPDHEDSEPEPTGATAEGAIATPPDSGILPAFCFWNESCFLPRELFDARTAIVCDPIYFCNDENMKQDVAWGGRWQLAADPAKADLILILCRTPSQSGDRSEPFAFYSALFVFKGGEQPDWDTLPLYLQFGYDHEFTLKELERMIAESARNAPSDGSR